MDSNKLVAFQEGIIRSMEFPFLFKIQIWQYGNLDGMVLSVWRWKINIVRVGKICTGCTGFENVYICVESTWICLLKVFFFFK